ncbi:E3 ubiquitin-protein ligase TRIM11-like [Megalops cyprinoides]|uniref:E3 ubiquitin-protein ligase TRIM11-like n=1 Tax=Megalops cyprinoides TaxID=118141 RepID=UPI001864B44B|nr:E3 ubiquitin-protein ligase TRIM11-like [Megalops cyprinoides]
MASIRDEGGLQEELTCPVCRDVFVDPHLLPCGHSVCLTCVPEGRRQRFCCPVCREEHGAGVSLRKNYKLANISLEYLRRGQPGAKLLPEVQCDCCPGDQAAVQTCLRCEVSLCADHLQPHLQRPAFRSHLLVRPLEDLSQRRCPEHDELFRYYCTDEGVYVCTDCVVEGKHSGHQLKSLKRMERDLKTVLQARLQKTEEKLRESDRVLKEHKNMDRTIMGATLADSQVERLGVSLQAQVERLVGALRDSATLERQQALLRLRGDYSRVTRDMNHTEGIHKYLSALLDERDPFLLIWAFQSEDKKISSELDSPLFSPEPVSLDRKRALDNIESRYNEFIAETLRCLNELKRDFAASQLTLDLNSAHPLLSISRDLRSAVRTKARLPCPAHPERFDHWAQVLTAQSFTSGTHYWELEAEGYWDIAVTYRSIGRKGKEGTAFGNNQLSWSLTRQDDGMLAVWHDRQRTPLSVTLTGSRVGVALDYSTGTITFSEAGSTLTHLHTFSTTFTQPVCLGSGLYKAQLHSRVTILNTHLNTEHTPQH